MGELAENKDWLIDLQVRRTCKFKLNTDWAAEVVVVVVLAAVIVVYYDPNKRRKKYSDCSKMDRFLNANSIMNEHLMLFSWNFNCFLPLYFLFHILKCLIAANVTFFLFFVIFFPFRLRTNLNEKGNKVYLRPNINNSFKSHRYDIIRLAPVNV